MKDRSHANRGKALEDFIRFANTRYEKSEIALIDKLPTEFIPLRNARGMVYSVKVEHKSKVDFIGRYKQYPIAIEAKNTGTQSISFDRVEPHQAAYMNKFTSYPGTIGLVLVSFNLERFFAVPWTFWEAAYDVRVRRDDRTSSVRVSAFGEEWDVPTKKSVRMEELKPEWEVSGRDTVYGLHFLQNVEKYIIQSPQNDKNIL